MDRKIYIGSDRWGRKEWNGIVFPANTDEKEQRKLYPTLFDFVEYRASYYQEQSFDTIKPFLKELENPDFKICPVIWDRFFNLFFYKPEETLPRIESSLASYKALGNNFGFSILQSGAYGNVKEKSLLYNMIEHCSHNYSMAIDFRKMEHLRVVEDKLITHLKKNSVGLIINDNSTKLAAKLESHYVYYRINAASEVPRLDELVLGLHEQVKEVYICVTGELQHQAKVAEVLMKYREEKVGLTEGDR